jgi:murein L,D-transpeptidase YcbB/YkuD
VHGAAVQLDEQVISSMSLSDRIEQEIRFRLQNGRFTCQNELICGVKLLPAFYAEYGYRPVWGLDRADWESAENMLDCIQDSASQAMDPSDYHLRILQRMLNDLKGQWPSLEPKDTADIDILLTDAFLTLAGHLRAGRVNPETFHPSWVAYAHAPDLIGALERALNHTSVQQELKKQLPPHAGYHKLRRSWEHYVHLAKSGGWEQIPAGKNLQVGDHSERVRDLKHRLRVTNDLSIDVNATLHAVFTPEVRDAVSRFQNRHGLRVDGVVGTKTLAALNVSALERAEQMALNMERWRWIPRDLGSPHVKVNVADFSLIFEDTNGTKIKQRVIVGKTARRTPVFSDQITHIVLNPVWNIPRSIMIEDILPKIMENPGYLQEHSITVLSGWGDQAEQIDPQSIDWKNVDPESFPYRMCQEPGPYNALGQIKFMFPNPFAIYLHDTPNKSLFHRMTRDFSSGCIRVEQPLRLAQDLLLGLNENWDATSLRTIIQSGQSKVIRFSKPVPVHLFYWTSWVDESGQTHFRQDIYNRDAQLRSALSQRFTVVRKDAANP